CPCAHGARGRAGPRSLPALLLSPLGRLGRRLGRNFLNCRLRYGSLLGYGLRYGDVLGRRGGLLLSRRCRRLRDDRFRLSLLGLSFLGRGRLELLRRDLVL